MEWRDIAQTVGKIAPIAGVSGWAGPRSIDVILMVAADRVWGAKK